ncbi:MAG: DNA-directed RNA polymerase subunit alpha [Patescibacteria group bacterium]|jgi:DNA-directed RNA polymerase subunit alpha
MENFLLPSKVEFEASSLPNTAQVVITPCYHGYGTTLGNALRRVLLSSLPGSAVEYFKVKGVQHEFSTIEGVKEDVVEIMLNLKQLAVKIFSDEPVILSIVKKGPGPITAGDIEANSNVEIINKDLVICTLTKNRVLEMEIAVGRGRGFRPVEEKDRQNHDLGTILTDSVYTPTRDVGYHVEYTRVGDITNYEKLTLNIETNGTISPREALEQATQILMDHFTIVLTKSRQGEEGESTLPSVEAGLPEEEKSEVEEKSEAKPKVKKAKKKKE